MDIQSTSNTMLLGPAGTLTVTAPPSEAGRSITVGPTPAVIGRDDRCDLILTQAAVSREHAVVRYQHGEFMIDDLGSSNGTLINGVRVNGPTILRDGDRLLLGDVQVAFHTTLAATAPRASSPSPGQDWDAKASTAESATVTADAAGEAKSLRHGLRDAPGFSLTGLALAVGGSVVGTVLTGAFADRPWGALAGAAVGPVVAAAFANRRAGEPRRVRAAAVVILSIGALAITVAGFGVADSVTGKAVVGKGDSTFPRPQAEPAHTGSSHRKTTGNGTGSPSDSGAASGPEDQVVPQALDCGSVESGASRPCSQTLTISSVGTRPLHITSMRMTGPDADDFQQDEQCVDHVLEVGESCTTTVTFRPQDVGPRTASLVIHQNKPRPDEGTTVALTGTGTSVGIGDPSDTPTAAPTPT
jgi:FHA domain